MAWNRKIVEQGGEAMRGTARSPQHDRRMAFTSVGVLIAALVVAFIVIHDSSTVSASQSAYKAPDPVTPLEVTNVTPASGSTAVPYNTSLTVSFSGPLQARTPTPTLSPSVPGTWRRTNPKTLTFTPSISFAPYAEESITIPGGPSGVRGEHGGELGETITSSFTVEPGSTLRLQELLAQLGYMPLTWTPAGSPPSTSLPPAGSPVPGGTGADSAAPQQGTFSWRWASTPGSLQALWQPGKPNKITEGAVMAFAQAHGLQSDGNAGYHIWSALLAASSTGQQDASPYTYIHVSKTLPETLTLWRNGSVVLTSPCNTGIAGAATPDGTWPIYLRYTAQTMRGVNPNGVSYVAPDVRWINYFHGSDAVHGYPRASYGFPQSVGCVELPIPTADTVWHIVGIGTLVTVVS